MFSAVLDACALFPQSLRDLLLRLSAAELFVPLWSARILEEMRTSLVEERGIDPAKVERTVQLMRESFEEAEVDAAKIEAIEPAMTNDAKDRHVLAAAVAAGAELIVTANVRHFPPEACAPLGVSVTHPDAFLRDLFDLDSETVYRVVADLTAGLRTMTFDQFLEALENAGVGGFVAELRAYRENRISGSEPAP